MRAKPARTRCWLNSTEQHRHQAKPERRCRCQIDPVTGLYRQRRVRVDHHGEQRQEKQRGFRVQAIGHEPRSEGAPRGALTRFLVQIVSRRFGRLRAQGLVADVQQVRGSGPFQGVEQHDRLRHDQPDPQQRITDVQENRRTDAQRRPGPGTATVSHALPHHHGEIRAGACNSQQVNQRNGQEFCPVHGGSFWPSVTACFIW
jgi:hypothetical protein